MKFVPKTFLAIGIAVVALLCVSVSLAKNSPAVFDPPPPPTPPPPPGLPLDGGIWLLIIGAVLFGLYITYQNTIKKARN